MVTRDCRRCGATFTSPSANARYCPACLAPRQCAECGVTFEVSVTRGIHARYCGHVCAMRGSSKEKVTKRGTEAVSLPLVPPPKTRAECPAERPCPHTGCRYHLPVECALDLADEGPHTLQEVAFAMGTSTEGVRQIEARAFRNLVAIHGRAVLEEVLSVPAMDGTHSLIEISREGDGDGVPAPEWDHDIQGVKARILAHLREHGPTSRDELWRALGLDRIRQINEPISELKKMGLVDGGGSKHHPEPYRALTPSPAPAQ